MADLTDPIHPGEILREELRERGLTGNQLANRLGVPPKNIREILNERRGISASTALQLSRAFGNSPEFWLNLQNRYELDRASDELGDRLEKIDPI
jgi:addiction module HigA family antidote